MIMPGPAIEDASEGSRRHVQPDAIGGRKTPSRSVSVAGAEAHPAQAIAAGAKIVIDLAAPSCGRCACTCREAEGRLRRFGPYTPWTA